MRMLLLVTLAAGFLLEGVASANVTVISVTSDSHLGTFAGKPYRHAQLQIGGVAPAGPYSVPAVLAYPTRAADANGFALVEPYNTVGFWFRDAHVPATPLAHARNILGTNTSSATATSSSPCSGTRASWRKPARAS